MDRVVVVLGIGRIDGDERQLAPILPAGEPGRDGGFRLLQHGRREDVRNAVGVDGDQADRALTLERAQLFLDARAGETKAAPAFGNFDRDQIAVLGVKAGIRRNGKLAAKLLLVDRRKPSATTRQRPEDAKHALLRAVDDLDDAPGVPDGVAVVACGLDAQQRPVADAAGLARPGAARRRDSNLRRLAVLLFIPLDRDGDQFAVAVARDDVGEHDVGECSGLVQLLAAALDAAFVGEIAQHLFEHRPVGILEAKCTGDFTRADFSRLLADEGRADRLSRGGRA